jgi:hypothetical protein
MKYISINIPLDVAKYVADCIDIGNESPDENDRKYVEADKVSTAILHAIENPSAHFES